ncbi:MAG: ABC transporter ATP-binding protein [Clostridiales bacterium]|nr:ABC transporter ATP-binding protein [Clostridiales bacterium]
MRNLIFDHIKKKFDQIKKYFSKSIFLKSNLDNKNLENILLDKSDDSIIKICGVSKKYKKKFVLKNISFCIKHGEVVGLVGNNGAGKTTLMRIITGLVKKIDGEIVFNLDKKIFSRNKKIIGSIIENPKFYPYMTGLQNLIFFGSLDCKISKKDLHQVVSLTRLSTDIKKKVKEYSLGMRQRLGIALALLSNPEILILDEPVNSIDPTGTKEIYKYLKDISKEKKTSILISSHSLSSLEKFCDRVCVLKKGELLEIIDVSEEKTFVDTIFAFELEIIDEFLEFIKEKNIILDEIYPEQKKVHIRLQKSKLSSFIKDLVLRDIIFLSVYEVKDTLEDKFLKIT